MIKNIVKEKLLNGENVVGCFLGFYSPEIVEIMGYSGYEFIIIDNEHGGFTCEQLENTIRTAELVGLATIVRVSYDPSSIQKALDRGAMGIQVPMVNNRQDAELVVDRVKFPPVGKRGTAFSPRAARYGFDSGKKYMDKADDNILTVVHIETAEAIENFEEIVSVQGIDVAFVGSTDLSASMGYRKEGASHVEVQKALDNCLKIGKKLNVPVGLPAGNIGAAVKGLSKGASYIGLVGNSIIRNAFINARKEI